MDLGHSATGAHSQGRRGRHPAGHSTKNRERNLTLGASKSGPSECIDVPLSTTVFPQFLVHADEAVARDHPHRDLIGELFSLKIWMVREHPHMPELVRHRCIELLFAQSR